MKQITNKQYAAVFIIFVLATGTWLHFWRIGYPSHTIFDEVHFATYSADYAADRPFFDIHPPLGKEIFAFVLAFYPRATWGNAQFIEFVKGAKGDLAMKVPTGDFGSFPYIPLRSTSAVFGILLPIAFYFLMRNLGTGRIAASLAALFVLFDNALLTDTRLILMDGMFLFLGITSLALYFHKKRPVLLAGAVLGLSLGVKVTAIVFFAPVFAAYLLSIQHDHKEKQERKRFIKFLVSAVVVLMLVSLSEGLFFTPTQRIDVLKYFGYLNGVGAPPPAWQMEHPVRTFFFATVTEAAVSFGGYTIGNDAQGESKWYFWPAMQIPIDYYYSTSSDPYAGNLQLIGNPIPWYAASMAAIAALALLYRYLKDRLKGKHDRFAFFILLGGYLGGLFPFMTIIRRSTYFYHYFPSLLFAFGLLAWFIAQWLKADDWHDLTPRKIFFLAIILLLTVAGFLFVAPLTYGIRR